MGAKAGLGPTGGHTAGRAGSRVDGHGRIRGQGGRGESLDGVLNVLKAPGCTSHDVVAAARRLLGVRRIGHTGTLDPGAAGVLVLCVGRATRLVELLQDQDKAYRAEMVLGVRTDSQDSFGKPISVQRDMRVSREVLDAVLSRFVGAIEQVPPMTSALRHKGRRLYELAREGVEVERAPRPVHIASLRIVRVEPDAPVLTFGTRVMIDIVCSKGTYVRTLCADIGDALGCGAYMSFLLRTRSGGFDLAHARTLEELEQDLAGGNLPLFGIDDALAHLPVVWLSAEGARRAAHGQAVGGRLLAPAGEARQAHAPAGGTAPAGGSAGSGPVRLKGPDGRLVAVADPVETPQGVAFRPRIVWNC